MTETHLNPPPCAGTLTAAVVLIGNEILNGRTQDTNLVSIAKALGERGIRVAEARVIADIPETIVKTINELRAGNDFVFTTGGIGPTHDDITADNVARAFGVELLVHPQARSLLLDYFESRGVEPNEARMRMARIPDGARLIDNPVSIAPGFNIGNVYVMAGVPKIMAAMLANVLPQLPDIGKLQSVSIVCDLPEGILAAPLEKIQLNYPDLELGSYPGKNTAFREVSLVVRGADESRVKAAAEEMRYMVTEQGGTLVSETH